MMTRSPPPPSRCAPQSSPTKPSIERCSSRSLTTLARLSFRASRRCGSTCTSTQAQLPQPPTERSRSSLQGFAMSRSSLRSIRSGPVRIEPGRWTSSSVPSVGEPRQAQPSTGACGAAAVECQRLITSGSCPWTPFRRWCPHVRSSRPSTRTPIASCASPSAGGRGSPRTSWRPSGRQPLWAQGRLDAASRRQRTVRDQCADILNVAPIRAGVLPRLPTENQVVLLRAGYREVCGPLRWPRPPTGPEAVLPDDPFSATQRNVATLYEYWCFFVLAEQIGSLAGGAPQGLLFEASSSGLALVLKQGQASRLLGRRGRRSCARRRPLVQPDVPSDS